MSVLKNIIPFYNTVRQYVSGVLVGRASSVACSQDLITPSQSPYKTLIAKMSSGDQNKLATFEDVKNLKDNIILIDVREPTELKETGVLPKSINIPLGEVENAFKNLPKDEFMEKYGARKPSIEDSIVFSCRSGVRSDKAMRIAETIGYTKVRNYQGGWLDWAEKIKQ